MVTRSRAEAARTPDRDEAESALDPIRGILISLALGGLTWGAIVALAIALRSWL